jgi:hypothetical protein
MAIGVSRRKFLRASLSSAAVSITGMVTYRPSHAEEKTAPSSAAEWIAASATNVSKDIGAPQVFAYEAKDLSGVLVLQRFKDPFYALKSVTKWSPTTLTSQALPTVTVPEGFVTDFASIPQVFWSIAKPDGDYAHAAVIHDYLYWQQFTTKAVADQIFWEAMEDLKIPYVSQSILFNAVKVFGKKAWDLNAAARKSGERRIVKKFPTDPTITWAVWKNEDDVFK